jgi:DNA-directed RNA polymerase specialized sigma24 family protein/FixJ family two-component response regulator
MFRMVFSRQILADVPMMRRFARAAAGGQPEGDAAVEEALSTLLGLPQLRLTPDGSRIALFRALAGILEHGEARGRDTMDGPHRLTAAQSVLSTLAPRPRIAFLLKALEGFSASEIAQILDCSLSQAEALIAAGSRAIADTLKTDILIIEDEPFIALDLEAIVHELGHRVVGVARTHREALDLIKEGRPGLVLSDIKLADGSSGLEAVNEILTTVNLPVIFITAFPERFLKGTKPEPAFLVTKPFLPETIRALISQALFFDRKAGGQDAGAARDRAQEREKESILPQGHGLPH